MPQGVEQWVWVSDFFGFSTGDMHPGMAQQFVRLSAVHYPERLGLYLVIDAPFIFEGLWRLVKSWLDPVTVQKIRFVPYDIKKGREGSKLIQALYDVFPADLAEWLIHEMAENRQKSHYTTKCSFHYKDVYEDALNGELQHQETHDLRGTKAIIQKYAENPSLLLPQANALL